MIELKNVSKNIAKKEILLNINLSFDEGNCYLISGPNGCGKTMLLRMICGLIKPTMGNVEGIKNKSFGIIIENPEFLKNETVMYNLKYLASLQKKIGVCEIEKWLNIFNLTDKSNVPVRKLSLGMKQRLALCQAFMENPDVLLLDEPFNALDSENLNSLKKAVENEKSNGKIIVVAAHNLSNELLNLFDYQIKMENGKIIED